MCKEIENSFETLRIQIKPQVLVVMQDLTNVKMCKTCKCEEEKIANIFGRIQICSGKSDQGQVQMGSCWDANSGKYSEKYTNVKRYMLKDICKYFWKDTYIGRQTRSRPSSNGFLL